MNTTYIIGNGFDICQNMATRYCQFYENHYVDLPRENISTTLKKFREEITEYTRKKKEGNVEGISCEIDWSDLESALGEYAEKLTKAQDYINIILDINSIRNLKII